MNNIPVIIPSYEPDERLLELLVKLKKLNIFTILVNDGSDSQFATIFNEACSIMGTDGVFLEHDINMGKGKALKTAFSYVIDNMPEVIGVVTADSDGQHACEDILKIAQTLEATDEKLILGVRDFNSENVPWKSSFGNNITASIFKMMTGAKISDTQTGLRGIPRSFFEDFIALPGNRFEFEMEMLIVAVKRYGVEEIKIGTIYDSATNHQTHFNPVKDSYKIYRALLKCRSLN